MRAALSLALLASSHAYLPQLSRLRTVPTAIRPGPAFMQSQLDAEYRKATFGIGGHATQKGGHGEHGALDAHAKHAATGLSPFETSNEASDPETPGMMGDRTQGALLMLLVAILWGSNFPAVKASLEAGLPASAAAAMRFSIAAVALLPLLRDVRSMDRELVWGGLECGCWIALGYIAQALALGDLQAGAVAFLASLQVVFVPLVLTAMGSTFTPRLALAAFLCIAGVALLELGGLSAQSARRRDRTPLVLPPLVLAVRPRRPSSPLVLALALPR